MIATPTCGDQLYRACCRSGTCALGYVCSLPQDSGAFGLDGSEFDPSDGVSSGYTIPDGSTLCALYAGPLDAAAGSAFDGDNDAGPARWCLAPATCTPYNGAWACCQTIIGGAGLVMCQPP